MTDTNFVWDPDHDQTYDLPQDIELTNFSFPKRNGSSFTLRSHATFTLKSNGETTWGEIDQEEPRTRVHLREGTLVFADNGTSANNSPMLLLAGADLLVDNDASFLVDAKSAYVSASFNNPVAGIVLSMAGRYNATCMWNSFKAIMIAIDDVASMRIEAAKIDFLNTTIRNTSSAEESLLLRCTAVPKHRMSFDSTTIRCAGASKSVIAALLVYDYPGSSQIDFTNTSIEVSEQADLHIQADTPSVDAQCRFHIGLGSPTLRFTSYTPGHSPFDFIAHTYPSAIFDFARAGNDQNKGQLMIQTAASIFQFNAMMAQGAVTINGQPADPRDLTWKPLRSDGVDYFVVALEDKPR